MQSKSRSDSGKFNLIPRVSLAPGWGNALGTRLRRLFSDWPISPNFLNPTKTKLRWQNFGVPMLYFALPSKPLQLTSSKLAGFKISFSSSENRRARANCVQPPGDIPSRLLLTLPQRRLSRDEPALAGHIPRMHQPLSEDYNQIFHTV